MKRRAKKYPRRTFKIPTMMTFKQRCGHANMQGGSVARAICCWILNAQCHNINMGNKSFEFVEHFKYSGTTLKHQNLIYEEITSRLILGNDSYHSVQTLLPSGMQ
jgi:hypothetical protein